jgi:hypothetical protein
MTKETLLRGRDANGKYGHADWVRGDEQNV